MRTALAVLLMLIFLGAFAYGVASFVSENSAGREIKILFCLLIATICIAAGFLGVGQDTIADELARRERPANTEPS